MSHLVEFLKLLVSWVPRLTTIAPTHLAVKVTGSRVRSLAPGYHWYIPALTSITEIPAVRQTLQLPAQTIISRDGKVVVVRGFVVFRIRDVEAVLTKLYDADEVIRDLACAAILRCIRASEDPSSAKLTKRVRRAAARSGFEVLSVELSDFAEARAIAHFGVHVDPALAGSAEDS